MWRLLFCLLLFQAQLSSGQDKVVGQVLDENNEALIGVNVMVFQLSDSLFLQGEITDAKGSFSVTLPPAGPYRIHFSYIGYEEHTLEVHSTFNLGQITLLPQSNELTEVEVRAKKPMLQRQLDRLVVNVEGNILSSGNSVLEILRRSPGVIVNQDDLISMSGRTGVRVYIDNKDTRLQGDALANLLRGMPAGTIEKVELITNPSVKYEAQGNAGIINIATKLWQTIGSSATKPQLKSTARTQSRPAAK